MAESKYGNASNGEEKLKGLMREIGNIEQKITQLSDRGMDNHVVIEDLTLDHPVLEKLIFHLDKLQLKDLSGALNLGNNFGVTVSEKSLKGKKPKFEKLPSTRDQQASETRSAPSEGTNRTENGYRFRFEQE